MVITKQFPGGLRLVVNKMEGLYSVSMGILVGTGSCFESAEENGISHFIEHMMFKGTHKRTAFEISDAMDRIGAQVNAFTSKDITCYYAKSTYDHAEEAFEILADFFSDSVFPEEEMVREKGVVCEEIAMSEDTPDDLCRDVLAQAFYGDEGYGRTILGPAENVRSFTREGLKKYIEERYNPQNVVVSFAGNIGMEEAVALVEKYLSSALIGRPFQKREKKLAFAESSLYKYKDIEQVHIAFGYPSLPREDKLMDASVLVNNILGGGMSSRLFQTVREKMGLAYTVYSYISSYTEGSILYIYAGINPANVGKAQEAIFKAVEDFRRDKFTKEEFLREKEQLKSSLIFSQESTIAQMTSCAKQILYKNEVIDFSKRIKEIEDITMEDCVQALELNYHTQHLAAAAVGKIKKPLVIR